MLNKFVKKNQKFNISEAVLGLPQLKKGGLRKVRNGVADGIRRKPM